MDSQRVVAAMQQFPTLSSLLEKYRVKDIELLEKSKLRRIGAFKAFQWLETCDKYQNQLQYLKQIEMSLASVAESSIINKNKAFEYLFTDKNGYDNHFSEVALMGFFLQKGATEIEYEPTIPNTNSKPEFKCKVDNIPYQFEVATRYDIESRRKFYAFVRYLDDKLSCLETGLAIRCSGLTIGSNGVYVNSRANSHPVKSYDKSNVDEIVSSFKKMLSGCGRANWIRGRKFINLSSVFREFNIEILGTAHWTNLTDVSLIFGYSGTPDDMNWVQELISGKERKFIKGQNNVLIINVTNISELYRANENDFSFIQLKAKVDNKPPNKIGLILIYGEDKNLIDWKRVLFIEPGKVELFIPVLNTWPRDDHSVPPEVAERIKLYFEEA